MLLLGTNGSLTALRDAAGLAQSKKQKAAPCRLEWAMGQAAANFVARMAIEVADKSRQLRVALFDGYHPELHYMRGPGPKWREKHSQMTLTTDLTALGVSALWKAGA